MRDVGHLMLRKAFLVKVCVPKPFDRIGDRGIDAIIIGQNAAGSFGDIFKILFYVTDMFPERFFCQSVKIRLGIGSDLFNGFLGSVEVEVEIAHACFTHQKPRALRGRDGVYYDFGWYKDHIDEVLGVEAEFSVKPAGAQTVDAVVTQHFDGGLDAEKTYTLTYGVNDLPDSEFSWLLQSVTLPEFAPEVDPALTFTWADVAEANKLENVLALYPAVRIYSVEYPEGGNTWIFQRNGNPALLVENGDYCSGQYMGCWFDYEADEDGVVRARIGGMDPDAGTWESLNATLLEGFRDASALRLDRIEKDLIWADCLYRGGFRQKLAFDRGTLVLRELVALSEEGEVFSSNRYDYSAPEPEFAFLDGWDETLRDVTVTWEDYDNGEQILFTETVSIPADWEYLPYEGSWGDYTVYNNTDYIGEYEYPGDNVDYELFLTTVKG